MDPLTMALLFGGLAAGASAFGSKKADPEDIMQSSNQYFAPGAQYGPNIPYAPSGNVTTSTGAGITGGQTRDFTADKKLQDKIKSGKVFKNDKDLQEAMLSGNPVNWAKLGKGQKNKLTKLGYSKPKMITPYTTPTADPGTSQYWDTTLNSELDRAQLQDVFNKSTLWPMVNNLAGVQNKAIGSAGNYLDQGFTENSPYIQNEINASSDAMYNEAERDLNQGYYKTMAGVNEELNNKGMPANRATASADYLNEGINREYANQLKDLGWNKQVYKRQLANDALANQRAGYGAVLQSPSMNAATSGLEMPGISLQSPFLNPTGQWDSGLLNNMYQYMNSEASNRNAQRMNLGQNLWNTAQGISASQPTAGQAIGNIAGTMAGYGMMGGFKGAGNAANPAGGNNFLGALFNKGSYTNGKYIPYN